MKIVLLIILVVIMSICGAAQAPPSIEGIWEGSIEVGAIKLRISFHITKDPSGKLSGTMDSPDQGAKGIPLSSVTQDKLNVTIESSAVSFVYEGTIDQAGTVMTGILKQRGNTIPLNLKKVEHSTEIKRPQEPKPPFPYLSEDVTYTNETDHNTLAGTLTLPKGAGPFPSVLLITGSGLQDRNESILGHKPFWVLADYLTRLGIAVLRVDDRGVGGSTGDPRLCTTADFAKDAEAGIAYLKSRKEIDSKKIGLIGHSEGGLIAAMIGSKSPDVAFIVFMAGPGVPGLDLLMLQAKVISEKMGVPESEEAVALRRKLFNILIEESDLEKARAKMKPILKEQFDKLSRDQQAAIGDADKFAEQTLAQFVNPWMKYFVGYDPRPAIAKIKVPLLALNGSNDTQVIPSQNLPAIMEAARSGGNGRVETKELQGLNHLFQKCKTGLPNEYGDIEETINPIALETMGSWIVKIVGKN